MAIAYDDHAAFQIAQRGEAKTFGSSRPAARDEGNVMPISPEQAASLVAHMRDSDGFTPAERARLEAMTDEEIERAARTDPDARLARPAALKRAVEARERRRSTVKKAV